MTETIFPDYTQVKRICWNFYETFGTVWGKFKRTMCKKMSKCKYLSCLQILHKSSALFHHRAFFRGRVYIIRLRFKYLFITLFIIWPHFSPTCWSWDTGAGLKDECEDSLYFPILYHLSLFVNISHIPLVFGILE